MIGCVLCRLKPSELYILSCISTAKNVVLLEESVVRTISPSTMLRVKTQHVSET